MKQGYAVLAALVAAALLTGGPVRGQEPARGQAVNVSGDWEITSETPRGPMTRKVTLEQDGAALSGSIETPMGSQPIQSGSVEGNEITFTVVMSRGDRSLELTYKGTVEGDNAKGTLQTPRGGEVAWTAKRVSGK